MIRAEYKRQRSIAAFRRASAMRLHAARLYRLGAQVLGELSAAGREAFIRGARQEHVERLMRLSDDEVREDARKTWARTGVIVADDGSRWVASPLLGPELPPDFPCFRRVSLARYGNAPVNAPSTITPPAAHPAAG